MGYRLYNNRENMGYQSAMSGLKRLERYATDVVMPRAGTRRKERRQLYAQYALQKRNAQKVEQVETCLHLMLPLVCQVHHMNIQKHLKEDYEDSEDSLRRRHEFLWRVEKHRKQQKEEEKARETKANREKEQQQKEEQRKQEENRREKQTEQESEKHVRHHIATSTNRSDSSEIAPPGDIPKVSDNAWCRKKDLLWKLEVCEKKQKEKQGGKQDEQQHEAPVKSFEQTKCLRTSKSPGLETRKKKEERRMSEETLGEKINDELEEQVITIPVKLEKKGANLYGAIKRNLTPTPAKFRICSDSDTDNSSTLNSELSAPSHWWHDTTSPSRRSQNLKNLNEDRLPRRPNQSKTKDEISGIAPEDRNLQCPGQSILDRFLQNAVLSPRSKRIRPDSGLLDIQTDYSIEMEQPMRRGMGTE